MYCKSQFTNAKQIQKTILVLNYLDDYIGLGYKNMAHINAVLHLSTMKYFL